MALPPITSCYLPLIFIQLEPKAPEVNYNASEADIIVVSVEESFQLICDIDGLPIPKIEWLRDGTVIENGTRLFVYGQTLCVTSARREDNEEFCCVGENRVGTATRCFKVTVNCTT